MARTDVTIWMAGNKAECHTRFDMETIWLYLTPTTQVGLAKDEAAQIRDELNRAILEYERAENENEKNKLQHQTQGADTDKM